MSIVPVGFTEQGGRRCVLGYALQHTRYGWSMGFYRGTGEVVKGFEDVQTYGLFRNRIDVEQLCVQLNAATVHAA